MARTMLLTSSSSSAIRMVPVPHKGNVSPLPSTGDLPAATGKARMNVVPLPTSEVTRIDPSWLSTMPRTAASPIPRPMNFVE